MAKETEGVGVEMGSRRKEKKDYVPLRIGNWSSTLFCDVLPGSVFRRVCVRENSEGR